MVASLAFIEPSVPAIQLYAVTLLELVVEVLEELVEGRRGLVGQLGEDERIGLVGHVSGAPQHAAERPTLAC
jgi:hypothetical protein